VFDRSRFRSGGLQYMVPAWVALHTLRRTGCQLPVEMWFAAREMPDEGASSSCRSHPKST
jgi:alpha 1,2-mannosyltransferase